MKEISIGQIASAVMWWLNYTSSVGREYILSEGAIKFPVSEYLERSTQKTDDIILEFGHPKFELKRFDLFYKNKNNQNVFEFKFIKNGSTRSSSEKQRVFNDLMRLYFFLHRKNRGYFLICGSQKDFTSDFQSLLYTPKKDDDAIFIEPKYKDKLPKVISPQGFYKEWFSFDSENPEKEIDLKNQEKTYKDIYQNFIDEYGPAYKKMTGKILSMPNSIKTNLIFLSGDISQPIEFFQPSKIAVWEVLEK